MHFPDIWYCNTVNWSGYSWHIQSLFQFCVPQLSVSTSCINYCRSNHFCNCLFWMLRCSKRKPLHGHNSKFSIKKLAQYYNYNYILVLDSIANCAQHGIGCWYCWIHSSKWSWNDVKEHTKFNHVRLLLKTWYQKHLGHCSTRGKYCWTIIIMVFVVL